MRFEMENPNTIVGSFRIWILACRTTKTSVLQSKTRIRKLHTTIVGSFRIWILACKTHKNMHFAMENPNMETVCNCR